LIADLSSLKLIFPVTASTSILVNSSLIAVASVLLAFLIASSKTLVES
jgi:hypothetical protein